MKQQIIKFLIWVILTQTLIAVFGIFHYVMACVVISQSNSITFDIVICTLSFCSYTSCGIIILGMFDFLLDGIN